MSQFIEMFGSVDDNPKSYDIKKVGDFAECFAGATPSTKISSYWDNGNIPWMSSGEVHKARVQDTDAKITQQGYDGCSTKMVPIHSIVIALAGQGKTRGTVAINDIELCTNQSLCAIVPNEEVNYEYLFHNLRGRYKELRSMSGDVDGRGGLNLKHIQSIKVIVPPMSEQMKFVSIARQADKSGFDGRKSQFIEMFGDPMVNTKCWSDYGQIGNYAQIVLGSTPNSKNPDYWDGEIKWITPAEMADESYYIYDTERHLTEEGLSSASLTLLPYRSVLFSTRAPIGKVGLVGSPMYCNQGFKNFICGEKLNPVYLYYALIFKREYLVSLGTGTTFKELSKKAVENLMIAVPPIALQNEFEAIYQQADKSGFDGRKSQFIEMFDFHELNFNSPSKDFESICLDDTSSATKIPAAEYLQEGKYAVYDQAQEKDIAGYSNTEQGLCRNYPAVLFGDHSRVVKYINEPFFIGADGVKIIRPRKDNLIPEFLYYDLKYHNIPNTGYNRHFKYIKMISLTKASLEEQSQFLSIAHQADKSGSGGRESVALMGKVKKSLINYYNI